MSAQDVIQNIRAEANELDTLTQSIEAATTELDRAEAEWDQKYDEIGESLADEYREAGRKSDPAEHTIERAARRAYRKEYTEYRNAKRNVEKLQLVLRARLGALSGRQSELKALQDENRLPSVAQPPWSSRQAA